jgi:hypothetical protein
VSRAQLLSNEPNEPNFSYYLSLLLQIIKQWLISLEFVVAYT